MGPIQHRQIPKQCYFFVHTAHLNVGLRIGLKCVVDERS